MNTIELHQISAQVLQSLAPSACPSCNKTTTPTSSLWRLERQTFETTFEQALSSLKSETDDATEHLYVEDFKSFAWANTALILEAILNQSRDVKKDDQATPQTNVSELAGEQKLGRGRSGPRDNTKPAGRSKVPKVTRTFLLHNTYSRETVVEQALAKAVEAPSRDSEIFRLYVIMGMVSDKSGAKCAAEREESEKQNLKKAENTYDRLRHCLTRLYEISSCVSSECGDTEIHGDSWTLVSNHFLNSLHKTSVKVRRSYSMLDFGDALTALGEFVDSLEELFIRLLRGTPDNSSSSAFKTSRVLLQTLLRLLSPLLPSLTNSLHSVPISGCLFLSTSEDDLTSAEKKQWLSLYKVKGIVATDKKRFLNSENTSGGACLTVRLIDNGLCEDVDLSKTILLRLCKQVEGSQNILRDHFLDIFFESRATCVVFDNKVEEPKAPVRGKGKLNLKQAVTCTFTPQDSQGDIQ